MDTTSSLTWDAGPSSLGTVLAARSPRGLCALLLGADEDTLLSDLVRRFPRSALQRGDAGLAQVLGLVEAPHRACPLPLDPRGTAFQQRVWQALRQIAPGTTLSYTQLAERIGAPAAVRAVAQACGANAIAVAIPCHRVLRRDGGLSGYRWGMERKRALLVREAQG